MPDAPDHPLYWLSPGVHAVAIADDLVFLDTVKDAYFCLPGPTDLAIGAGGRGLSGGDFGLAQDLCNAGLISPIEPPHDPAFVPTPARPNVSAVALQTAPPAWRHVKPAAHAVADVLWRYRGKSLAAILRCAASVRPTQTVTATPELLEVVAAFQSWIPYAPVSGKCLLRSFMLLRLLRRHGHDALWVFAVRTWPFHAHCWLQCGDVVLDDDAERVAAFTPLMAV